jgi:hypothetical protein
MRVPRLSFCSRLPSVQRAPRCLSIRGKAMTTHSFAWSATCPREGNPSHADRPPYTIGLAKAMDRYELLYGPGALGASRDEFELLKAARDLAAHGEGSREVTEDMHRVLVTLATVVDAGLPQVGVSPGDFWGDHVGLIAYAMEKQRDKVVARARTLISAAKQRFAAKYAGVPMESLEALMMESAWQPGPRRDEWFRKCPACDSQGISRLRAEIRRQAVSPHRRVVAGFKAIDFRCPICNLALESEELVDAAVRSVGRSLRGC